MIGIADLAGGDWPKRARDLALEASKPDRRATDEMYSVLILGDLRDLFIKEAVEKRFSPTGDKIPSAEVCMSLGAMPERPWASYGRSRALITQMKVAELLAPFEVLPKTIWCTENRGKEVVKTAPRGYDLKDCRDAFERNLPPLDPPTPPSSSPETSFQGASVPDPFSPNGLEPPEQGTSDSSTGTLKTEPKPLGENGSGTLAGQNADFGGARAQAGSNGTENDRLIERADPDTDVSTGGVFWPEIQRRVAVANASLVAPDTRMFDEYTREAVIRQREAADAAKPIKDASPDGAQEETK